MNKDEATGVANLSPEMDLRPGEVIHFDAKQLQFEGESGYYMPIGSQMGILLGLSFRDDEGHHTTGSAAMVGPGIAVCAAHVLEDQGYLKKLEKGDAALVAQAPLADGTMLLWTVHRIACVQSTDLAVLSLSLSSSFPADRRFCVSSMTTRLPAIGDELVVTGFSATQRTQERSSKTRIELMPGCFVGKVMDLYPNGRDRTMLPGPCFAVECNARGGMSGGPVFDRRGHLVGLVSSSYEGDQTTFVSHIWPALAQAHVVPVWPGSPYKLPEPGSLLMMGRKHGITIDRPDAFQLGFGGNQVLIRYVPWT